MDGAIAVVSGRSRGAARAAMSNTIIYTALVGSLAAVLSVWAFGAANPEGSTAASGFLATIIPNLEGAPAVLAAVSIPGELFFAIGLYGLVGRRRVTAYNGVRLLRRATLLCLLLAFAGIGYRSIEVALVANLAALAAAAATTLSAASLDGSLGGPPELTLLFEQLRFGARNVLGSLAERLQFRADAFLVNLILGVGQTGVYSVAAGLAETLWYLPNSLGVVMLSRSVDPVRDASWIACRLSRTALALTSVVAVPVWLIASILIDVAYGSAFADAVGALRAILPGVVAYSVVAVLSRYIVGSGAPGTATIILVVGAALNVASNLVLIPRLGIAGAGLASTISYSATAVLMVGAFVRISGRSVRETVVPRRQDLVVVGRALGEVGTRLWHR